MEWFFILGCQRSGTTLMRLVLETHCRVFCFDEGLAYSIIASGRMRLPKPASHVGFKIPRWTEQLGDDVLWDEGMEQRVPNFYRGQKIIFMLRNVKDSIASMLKLRSGDVSWLEWWGKRIVNAKIGHSPPFRQRYGREIRLLEEARDPLIATAALYWKYKTQAYFDYRDGNWPVLAVKYEQLVAAPETVLRGVCDFLNLAWEPALLNHSQFPHTELSADGRAIGGTDPERAIDQASVGQWTRFLTAAQLEQIAPMTSDLEARLAVL